MRHLTSAVFAVLICCSLGVAITLSVSQDPPEPSEAALELAARIIGGNGKQPEPLSSYPDHIDLDLRRGLIIQANHLMDEHRFADALRGYELARQVAERIGDRRGGVAALLGIGTIHGRQGEYEQAALALRQGLAIDEEINDSVNEEVALNNLGIVRKLQGEYEEAIDYYRRALALAPRARGAANVARILNNIGTVQMLRGSYEEALQDFQQSLKLKEETKQFSFIPGTLGNIGNVYEKMGDDDLALEYYQRSERVNEQLGERMDPEVFNQLGQFYAHQGRYDLALDYYQRALALHEKAGSQAEIAETLQNLGGIRRARGDLSGAMGDLRHSLEIRERINDRHGAAETLLDISATLRQLDNPSAALEAARKAVRLSREVGGRETLWRTRLAEGEILEALGKKDAAHEAYAEAVDLIEQLRGDAAGGDEERQLFLEGRLEPFHRLASLLVAEDRKAEALEMAERAKARVMLDVLRMGRSEFRLLSLEERDRQRKLERDMSASHARLQAEEAKDKPDERAAASVRESWRKARAADAEFRTVLYEKYPQLRLSLGDAAPGSLDDAGAIVNDGSATLVEYMVTPESTYAFVVTRDGSRNLSLSSVTIKIKEDDLRRETGRLRQQLAARDLDFEQTARGLYQRLMGKVDLRGKTNLIIVPDGPLWEVPFQTLAPRPKHYLIEDAAISIAPSIAVLRETRAKRARVESQRAPRLVALADQLPETANQVRHLQQIYGTSRSDILLGGAASAERFVSAAGDATVLHLATHGILDYKNPMYSFLQLPATSATEAGREGRLEAWQIMKLSLHAEVTVLAACETGRGRIGAGEGVIGLVWAFFLAGTPRTVVSLWKVDAESTSDLMLAFHRQLRDNLTRTPGHPSAAASLRAATLSLLRDPRYRHPFYWGSFVVVGDGS